MFGPFYNSRIGCAASKLMQALKRAISCEEGDILSPKNRADFEKYVSTRNQGEEVKPSKAGVERVGRFLAAQWLVWRELQRAADWVTCCPQSPLGFLAGLFDVEAVPLIVSEFDRFNGDEEVQPFYIATSKALANANVLLCQLRELSAKHGPTISEFLQEPLSSLLRDLKDLEEFARGDQVDWKSCGTLAPGHEGRSCPKPVTAFPTLTRQALMAGARPTNNSGIESKWSLSTGRYHASARNFKADYLAETFRQKDVQNAGVNGMLNMEGPHLERFKEAREFVRKERPAIGKAFASREEESQKRLSRSQNVQECYPQSNIQTSFSGSGKGGDVEGKSSKVLKKPAAAAAPKRSDGSIAKRHESSVSSGSEDSAEESEEAEGEESEEAEGEDAEAEEPESGSDPASGEPDHCSMLDGPVEESRADDNMDCSDENESCRGSGEPAAGGPGENASTSNHEPEAAQNELVNPSGTNAGGTAAACVEQGVSSSGDARAVQNEPANSSGESTGGIDPAGQREGPADQSNPDDSDESDLEDEMFSQDPGWGAPSDAPSSQASLNAVSETSAP